VAKQARADRHTTCIRGRVTSTDNLDALESHELMVLAPVAAVLHQLADQSSDGLGFVRVRGREVDFIAEYHEPATWL